eukprot:gene6623-4743_t
MFRRLFHVSRLPVAAAFVRCYTPSEELKTLYASEFDKAAFPCDMVPSDSVLFAKFLYKAAEPENAFDAILGDFKKIAAAVPRLPVFWERTCKVDEVDEFKGLTEPVRFTLEWMQSNGMLDQLVDVAEVYETYVNAKMNRVTVKIYVGQEQSEEVLQRAKDAADALLRSNASLAGFSPVYKICVDRSIVEGFSLDVQGMFHSEAKGVQVETGAAGEADYTAIPVPHLPKTTWADNVETEVLRSYLNSLAQYDAEEVKTGV